MLGALHMRISEYIQVHCTILKNDKKLEYQENNEINYIFFEQLSFTISTVHG